MKELNSQIVREIVQDCSVNFLVGSGMSAGYLSTLGNIEILLTDIEALAVDDEQKQVLRGSVYKKYCDDVIFKNLKILNDDTDAAAVLESYKKFVLFMNCMLLERKSSILNRQINIFTTNIDIFFEKALEASRLEFNDGFVGRFAPIYDLSSFKKSYIKKSSHYDNISEIPVFNLLKLHGSLTWKLNKTKSELVFAANLADVVSLQNVDIDLTEFVVVSTTDTADTLSTKSAGLKTKPKTIINFQEKYDELSIVNPTKEKFRVTLLNEVYYDLLRMYSNELEKENSVLFVLGFSFADEHIRHITLRAANSNPTLAIHVFAYTSGAKKAIEETIKADTLKYDNVIVWGPAQKDVAGTMTDSFKFDFDNIQKCAFSPVSEVGSKSITGISA